MSRWPGLAEWDGTGFQMDQEMIGGLVCVVRLPPVLHGVCVHSRQSLSHCTTETVCELPAPLADGQPLPNTIPYFLHT